MEAVKETAAAVIDPIGLDTLIEFATETEYRLIDLGEGRTMRIGSITAAEFTDWLQANEEAKHTASLRLIIKSVVDKDGKRTGKMDQLESLKKVQHKVIEKILAGIMDLNGMNKEGEAKAKNA